MEVDVTLPVQIEPPPHVQAMILGTSGLEKLGLEISIQKAYVYPVKPRKKGSLLHTKCQLEMNLPYLPQGVLLLCNNSSFHLYSIETVLSV